MTASSPSVSAKGMTPPPVSSRKKQHQIVYQIGEMIVGLQAQKPLHLKRVDCYFEETRFLVVHVTHEFSFDGTRASGVAMVARRSVAEATGDALSNFWVAFPLKLIPTCPWGPSLGEIVVIGGCVGAMLANYLQALEQQIICMSEEESGDIAQITSNMLMTVLSKIGLWGKVTGPRNRVMSQNRAAEYIQQHIANVSLKISDICRDVGISRRTAYRMFAPFGGIRAYINGRRLEEARRLLEASKLKIAEIAFRSGFNTPDAFRKAYKKRFGKAPRATRRHLRGHC